MHSEIIEDPKSLTLLQWLSRAVALNLRDAKRRILSLIRSFPKNYFRLRRLIKIANAGNRSISAVILTDRLGDIVAAHPAIEAYSKDVGSLIWLVRPRFADILKLNPHVKEVICVSSYTETILLKFLLRRINWKSLQIDGALCNVFGFRVKNPNSHNLNIMNYYNFGALTDIYYLIAHGCKKGIIPKIYHDDTFDVDAFFVSTFCEPNRPTVIIHSASEEAARSINIDVCQQVASWIEKNTNYNIIELGLDPVLTPTTRICCVQDKLNLSEQAVLMKNSKIFIGVDSGFAHLANAFYIPSLLLIGKYHNFSLHLPWILKDIDYVLRANDYASKIEADQIILHLSNLMKRINEVY